MILDICGWRFDVDLTETMAYSAREAAEHCTCAYCRNYYASVDTAYPELRGFLAQFGVDPEAPAELFPYEATACEVVYLVCGRILHPGDYEIDVGNAHVLAVDTDRISLPDVVPETLQWFALQVMDLNLPWVLKEPSEEVISPANEPSFLKRMRYRLLEKAKRTTPS